MNDTADAGAGVAWRASCSARFSSAACGGRFARALSSQRPALWFLGSLLLRTSIVLAGFYLRRARSLGAAAGVSARIRHRAPRRDAADPAAGRTADTPERTGGQPCALVPMRSIFWQYGFLKLNATIVFTWGLMLVLAVGSRLITRKLSTDLKRSRWQNLLEIVVTAIAKQIEEVGLRHPEKYLGFLGTLFLFVAAAASAPSFPATSRRRARSRPPRRSRCACSWPCRCSASRSRAWAATSSPT